MMPQKQANDAELEAPGSHLRDYGVRDIIPYYLRILRSPALLFTEVLTLTSHEDIA